MCMYMYNFNYSQSISCRRLLSFFLNVFVWHNSSIIKHEYEAITTITIQFVESLQSKLSSSVLLLSHTSIVHVFWCPHQTQHLQFQVSFTPEDHIDWETAPPSYDRQSSGRLYLNESLRIFYSCEQPKITLRRYYTKFHSVFAYPLLDRLYVSTGGVIVVTTASASASASAFVSASASLKMLEFLVKVFQSLYLLNPWMDLVDALPDVRYWSDVLCCNIKTHIGDLEIKVTDLKF